jgi:DNA mismatch repair protein MSH5
MPPPPVSRNQPSPANVALSSTEGDDQLQDQSYGEELEQVIMAIDMKERETVGCCYYVAQEEKLYLLEDVRSGGMEIIETRRAFRSSSLLALIADVLDSETRH